MLPIQPADSSPAPAAAAPPVPPPAAVGVGTPSLAPPNPAVGPSGTPGTGTQVPAPVGTPVTLVPAPAPAAAPVVADELATVRADRARLEAEVARLTPWAQKAWKTQDVAPAPAPQGQPAPAAAPAAVNVFGVPKFDQSLLSHLTEDAAGNITEKPGAPQGTLYAYQQYQRAKGQAVSRIVDDPEGALAPLLEKVRLQAVEDAKKSLTTEQQTARHAEQARTILARNSEWLFERDAAGQPVMVHDSLTGQSNYKLRPEGQVWHEHVRALQQAGVTDPEFIDRYARAAALNDLMARQQAQQPAAVPPVPPAAPVADLRQAFLAQVPGALPPGTAQPDRSGVPPAATTSMSLRDMLKQDLIKAGHVFPAETMLV